MRFTPSSPPPGFSLMEMSLVMVIIGVIMGSVLTGTTLYHNSRLQSVMTDFQNYQQAIQLFQTRYQELPGDLDSATGLWGDEGDCGAPAYSLAARVVTCNGNGDGFIGDSNGSLFGAAANWAETYRAWQHLSDAGLIAVTYSGVGASGHAAAPGVSIPASKIIPNGYTLYHAAPTAPGEVNGAFGANYHHVLVYGAAGSNWDAPAYNPGLSVLDAMHIDEKLDDGRPGTGIILSFTSQSANTPNCANGYNEQTALYNAAAAGLQCSLIFITGF